MLMLLHAILMLHSRYISLASFHSHALIMPFFTLIMPHLCFYYRV
jgi:hypothetical protein